MRQQIRVPIVVEEGGILPCYARPGDSGLDVFAPEAVTVAPGAAVRVNLRIKVAAPEGFEFQVRPKSGLAARDLVTVLNTPGTVDSGFRGAVEVCLINHGNGVWSAPAGAKIAQLVLTPVVEAIWEPVAALPESTRGAGGFGSTGA